MTQSDASTQNIRLLYDRNGIEVRVPGSADILRAQGAPTLSDPEGAIRDALRQPIESAPLAELARVKQPKTVVITISDITRPVPNEPILRAILAELAEAGVTPEQVTVLVATGMHRPSTDAERVIMLGEELAGRLKVVDHVASDAASLVTVSEEPPVSINRLYAEADLKIVTGLIEPHFMAGYSGGRKGICPGLVDLASISRFHGFQTMSDRRSTEGNLEGNPCHEEALRVSRLVGCDFLVNCAIDEERRLSGIYVGDIEAAHAFGCKEVESFNSTEIDKPYDLVITNGGGYPLDESFYQTIKGIVTALPALHGESTLLIASKCVEAGSDTFTQLLHRYDQNWQGFLRDIEATDEIIKDQWSYQMQTRVLDRVGQEHLLLASDGMPLEEQARLSVSTLPSEAGDVQQRVQVFIDEYVAEHPDASIAVIPEGPYTMLRLSESVELVSA